jgi:hypothetical protein
MQRNTVGRMKYVHVLRYMEASQFYFNPQRILFQFFHFTEYSNNKQFRLLIPTQIHDDQTTINTS